MTTKCYTYNILHHNKLCKARLRYRPKHDIKLCNCICNYLVNIVPSGCPVDYKLSFQQPG